MTPNRFSKKRSQVCKVEAILRQRRFGAMCAQLKLRSYAVRPLSIECHHREASQPRRTPRCSARLGNYPTRSASRAAADGSTLGSRLKRGGRYVGDSEERAPRACARQRKSSGDGRRAGILRLEERLVPHRAWRPAGTGWLSPGRLNPASHGQVVWPRPSPEQSFAPSALHPCAEGTWGERRKPHLALLVARRTRP